jgi:hypothetical protein
LLFLERNSYRMQIMVLGLGRAQALTK